MSQNVPDKKLGQILIEAKVITVEQLAQAIYAQESRNFAKQFKPTSSLNRTSKSSKNKRSASNDDSPKSFINKIGGMFSKKS